MAVVFFGGEAWRRAGERDACFTVGAFRRELLGSSCVGLSGRVNGVCLGLVRPGSCMLCFDTVEKIGDSTLCPQVESKLHFIAENKSGGDRRK